MKENGWLRFRADSLGPLLLTSLIPIKMEYIEQVALYQEYVQKRYRKNVPMRGCFRIQESRYYTPPWILKPKGQRLIPFSLSNQTWLFGDRPGR